MRDQDLRKREPSLSCQRNRRSESAQVIFALMTSDSLHLTCYIRRRTRRNYVDLAVNVG